MTSSHYSPLESRAQETREKDLFGRLPKLLAELKSKLPAWSERLSGIDPTTVTSREALAKIPVMRKPELMAAQSENPPFGGFVDETKINGSRIFMSPGPVWEPQGLGADPWKAACALFAAGFREGDRVHNVLAYHQTPGGFIMDEGLRALGAIVFPAGPGNTEAQVQAAGVLQPVAYAGTPDYLKVILDKAEEMNVDLSCIEKAMVSGGALFPSMRQEYAERGVRVTQCFATADIGVIAYETWENDDLCDGMVVSEDMIVEIVRPGSDDPVEPGEVGEIVVTNFHDTYPLIRFGTGDMTAVIESPSPCGRTNMRIKGWMGRADQRTKVKGMFVDPKQIDQIVKTLPDLKAARLTVSREGATDVMTLSFIGDAAEDEVEAALASITKLKGKAIRSETLPNDGKVIDDQRDYEK